MKRNGIELRCKSQLHGILKDFGDKKLIEVKCKDRRCAARGAGMVVFHYWDAATGAYSHTKRYKDPISV